MRRPAFIRVGLDEMELEALAADRVRISFRQSYESNTYSDKVRKVVEMVEAGGGWRIASEGAE